MQLKKELTRTLDELQQICSHFNSLEAMKGTVDKIRRVARIVTDIRAKEEFNSTAHAIGKVSTDLANDVNVRDYH